MIEAPVEVVDVAVEPVEPPLVPPVEVVVLAVEAVELPLAPAVVVAAALLPPVVPPDAPLPDVGPVLGETHRPSLQRQPPGQSAAWLHVATPDCSEASEQAPTTAELTNATVAPLTM